MDAALSSQAPSPQIHRACRSSDKELLAHIQISCSAIHSEVVILKDDVSGGRLESYIPAPRGGRTCSPGNPGTGCGGKASAGGDDGVAQLDVPIGYEGEAVESGVGCSVVAKIDVADDARVGSGFKGDSGGTAAAPEIYRVVVERIVSLKLHVHGDIS